MVAHTIIPTEGKQKHEDLSGTHWPVSLAEWVSSTFSERPCLKRRGTKKERGHGPLASIHAHMHTHARARAHTLTCTRAHTHAHMHILLTAIRLRYPRLSSDFALSTGEGEMGPGSLTAAPSKLQEESLPFPTTSWLAEEQSHHRELHYKSSRGHRLSWAPSVGPLGAGVPRARSQCLHNPGSIWKDEKSPRGSL